MLPAALAAFLMACTATPPTTDESWTAPAPGSAPAGSPVALHGALRVVRLAGSSTSSFDGGSAIDGGDAIDGGSATGVAQLVDQYGAPVQLKGVSSYWLNYETVPFAENKAGLQFMRDHWKLSVIRAAMGIEAPGGYRDNAVIMKKAVEKIIHHAIDLGVYVSVDWHTEKAVDQQASSVAFFTEMATAYGAYPNVIWEPYNEPTGFQWDQIKPYHQAVVDAVRKVDPDNLIVLGTPNWSQYVNVAAADPVAGSNLLYTLHWYSCTHGQHFRDLGDQAIAAGAALFVTEYGATFADGGIASNYVCEDEANLWYAWMAAHTISGIAWKLDQGTDTSAILNAGAGLDGNWTDDKLSSDVGGQPYEQGLKVSGTAIKGGHGLFIVNWLRQ